MVALVGLVLQCDTMKPLLATLILTNGVALVRFATPGPGSYQVATTADFHAWRVAASGYVSVASHVAAKLPAGGKWAFYSVTFRKP
jgi:hypothetical protein